MSDAGKIVKHHSLKHADRVLAELRKIWPKSWEGWLRVWANGREQGYHLTVVRWNDKRGERAEAACLFAEGRSCDGALVVIGRKDQFTAFGNPEPTDELWADRENGRRYFYDTTSLEQPWSPELRGRGDKLAAKWIVKRFRQLLAEDLKKSRQQAREYAKSRKARAS